MKRIDLTDSKEWYRTNEQAEAYLNLFRGAYSSGIVQAEDSLLKNNLDKICQASPERISYIDLGPGNGEKTFLLCDALNDANKLSSYVAVDIQPKFLDISEKIESKYKIPSLGINQSFEEFLSKPQPFEETPKFIYLGSTFGNFIREPIAPKLTKFMRKQDLVYLSAGLHSNNLDDLIKSYDACLPMFKPVAERRGLSGGKLKVVFNSNNSSIEQVYEKNNSLYILGISKKYSPTSFKEHISKYFDGEYFIEEDYIGFIGRKK